MRDGSSVEGRSDCSSSGGGGEQAGGDDGEAGGAINAGLHA